MKAQKILGLFVILSLMLMVVPAAQAGGPPGNWASGIACQNLSSSQAANVTLYFYQEDNPSPVLTYVDPNPVPADGFRGYYTPSSPPGVPDGFLGSVVVSSNTEMACNVNTQTTGSGTLADPYRIGTSAGFNSSQIAPKMYAPQIMKAYSGWNSYLSVMNTSSSSVSVTISYKDRYGTALSANETRTIPGNTNHIFYQSDNANLPTNLIGSAVISADNGTTNLAVTAEFYNSAVDNTTAQLHAYNGFSSGATKLLLPRFVRNYYGYNSGISIQNVGNASTTVSITFTDAINTKYYYNSGAIAAGASLVLYAPNIVELNPMDLLNVTQRFGNAVITSTGGVPIVAIVNEDNRGGGGVPPERVGQGSTYNGFVDGAQTNTAFFPQITRHASGVFSGGFQVSNTSGNPGTCDIFYTNASAANQLGVAIPANGTISKFAPNVPNLPDGFNSSVRVTCTVPIVGIANLAVDVNSGRFGDSFTTSNGLNK